MHHILVRSLIKPEIDSAIESAKSVMLRPGTVDDNRPMRSSVGIGNNHHSALNSNYPYML